MNVLITIFLTIFTFYTVFAQNEQKFSGRCPVVSTKANFSEPQFKGRWYEIRKFANNLIPRDCGSPNYIQQGTGYTITYDSRNVSFGLNHTDTLVLKRQVIGSAPGKYDVYYKNIKEKIPHFVLDTDYSTYSVVWGCSYNSTSNINSQRLFIYSRTKSLNSTAMNNALQVLNRFKIDNSKLQNVIQDDKKCARKK